MANEALEILVRLMLQGHTSAISGLQGVAQATKKTAKELQAIVGKLDQAGLAAGKAGQIHKTSGQNIKALEVETIKAAKA